MIAAWPGPDGEEYALAFDRGREIRLLVLPALFDEANKLRHFTAETLRLLDALGIDAVLPDLPGCNESLAPLERQTLAGWRDAAGLAAAHFGCTHLLAIRGGALCAPNGLPAVHYAPAAGAALLRGMLRARVIASKEAGIEESRESLLDLGLREGLDLAGYRLGPALIGELQAGAPPAGAVMATVAQPALGGPGLWLRAEPDHSPEQAAALANAVAAALRA